MNGNTISALWNSSRELHKERPALGWVKGEVWTYGDVDRKITALRAWLEEAGTKPGDRIALWSENQPLWGVIYLAAATSGRVIVPFLPDLTVEDVETLCAHSEARILFRSARTREKSENLKLAPGQRVVEIPELDKLDAEPQAAPERSPEEWAALIYTSGTTGNPKGVMLSQGNVASNAYAAVKIPPIHPGDVMLSLLPLAHTYEATLGFFVPMIAGSAVYYLDKPPSPAVLLPALETMRPHLVLSVPLLIEKIYKAKIRPKVAQGAAGVITTILPFLKKPLARIAGKKLMKTFGGRIAFFGIGGAPLDPEVEKFLKRAGFPYAIGYGLTETSPLVAGCGPEATRLRAIGPVLDGVEVKLDDFNPRTGVGEVLVKGPNVMMGYYKNPEATREVLGEDGWFRTGDLGILDKNGVLALRGRKKNLILGPSGENIYPEAIESQINNYPHVMESLVFENHGHLVAKVVVNLQELMDQRIVLAQNAEAFTEWAKGYAEELKAQVNRKLAAFSRISKVVVESNPFEKTATQKIRRFKHAH